MLGRKSAVPTKQTVMDRAKLGILQLTKGVVELIRFVDDIPCLQTYVGY